MKATIALIIALITGASFYASSQNNKLDGKTFRIKLRLIDGKRVEGSTWLEGELNFKAGSLTPKYMSKHEDFPPAPCEIKVDTALEERTVSFFGNHKNNFGSEIILSGKITG